MVIVQHKIDSISRDFLHLARILNKFAELYGKILLVVI